MIETAVKTLIENITLVSTVVGDRVFYMIAEDNQEGPYITYQGVSSPPGYTLEHATDKLLSRFQIDIYSESGLEALQVRNAVISAIKNYRGTIGGVEIDGTIINNFYSLYESATREYRQLIDVSFWHDME